MLVYLCSDVPALPFPVLLVLLLLGILAWPLHEVESVIVLGTSLHEESLLFPSIALHATPVLHAVLQVSPSQLPHVLFAVLSACAHSRVFFPRVDRASTHGRVCELAHFGPCCFAVNEEEGHESLHQDLCFLHDFADSQCTSLESAKLPCYVFYPASLGRVTWLLRAESLLSS